MNEEQFQKYISAIIREIERHKWFESEKAGRDVGGNTAAFDWLEKHYESWKEAHAPEFATGNGHPFTRRHHA